MKRKLSQEQKAGLYTTVIIHLGIVIILLAAGLHINLQRENSFVLDFSKMEEMERIQEEIAKLEKEAEMQQAIAEKLQRELGNTPSVRNVAVDRSSLKDDRGTDADQLYKDAERLQKELNSGYELPEEDVAEASPAKKQESKPAEQHYSGPSVVSYSLDGRKASKLPIPAYRCMGAGRVTVLIVVDPAGTVIGAKVDESVSSSDGCLRAFAIRAARMSKFSASASAPAKQAGNIVYEFIAQ